MGLFSFLGKKKKSTDGPPLEVPAEWKTYNFNLLSFRAPKGWRRVKGGDSDTVRFTGPGKKVRLSLQVFIISKKDWNGLSESANGLLDFQHQQGFVPDGERTDLGDCVYQRTKKEGEKFYLMAVSCVKTWRNVTYCAFTFHSETREAMDEEETALITMARSLAKPK